MDRETRRRQARLREVFRSFDLDMSGKIEKDELLTLVKARRHGASGGGYDGEKNERLVNRVSLDSDGKVSQNELVKYFTETWHGGMDAFSNRDFDDTVDGFMEAAARAQRLDKKRRRTRLTEVFQAFDLDKDDLISSEELYRLARAKRVGTVNPEWTREKNESLLKRVDLNSDGQVSLTEFLQYFSTQWQGGLSLFSSSDFEGTIKLFLQLPTKAAELSESDNTDDDAPAPRVVATRAERLGSVFHAFDIDGGGTIGAEELLALGKARRATGQASGDWTEERNRRLMSKMASDGGKSGEVSESEFVGYFGDVLSSNPAEFEKEITNFLEVARSISQLPAESTPAVVPRINLAAANKSDTASEPLKGFQGQLRTPREREAGLMGIFRMYDMERTGTLHKDKLTALATQAAEKGSFSGSWSAAQNQAALGRVETSRGNQVAQAAFVDFFQNKWYNGMGNLEDAEYERAMKLLRTLGRHAQTESAFERPGSPRSSYGASSPASPRKQEESAEQQAVTRKRNMKLREVFSLLDFGRKGDLNRADLRVLGVNSRPVLEWMDAEGKELCNQSDFLERQSDCLSKDPEEFEAETADMQQRAQASRKAKEGERRERRLGKLSRVFEAFDLDGNGTIDKGELYELGKARRGGQGRGAWTEEKNNRLVEKLDADGDGDVSSSEFTNTFETMLSYNESEFDTTIADFMVVAEQVHLTKSKRRQAALDNMNPIERAKHEANAFTKDADIDIFKTKQEQGVKDDLRKEGEALALDKAIKELLARQAREQAHEELVVTENQEGEVKREKVVAQEEHTVAEVEQEKSVKIEAKRAEDVEEAIASTQTAHKGHRVCVTEHQQAVAVVDAKTTAKAQRAKEVEDLEELLRLARIAFAVAEQELQEAEATEDQKGRDEREAKETLRLRKIEQAEAEEEHRIAHGDMVDKTKEEKEKHAKRKFEEHRHSIADDMVASQVEVEKLSIKEMETAIESAMKQARIAVDRRDDHSDAVTEAELAAAEKKVRGVEEIAARDWWNAEEARMCNQKEQIVAAEKQENLKKAELLAEWEDRRSGFAKNRGRDESVVLKAQDEAASLSSVYQSARKRAGETQQLSDEAALEARNTTDVAKSERNQFDEEILDKRAAYSQHRQTAGQRGTDAYREFLQAAMKEISSSDIDKAALALKVARALAMAMKGVDIYASIPAKPIKASRQPAPPSKYDDEDYVATTPLSPPRAPQSPRFKKSLVVADSSAEKEDTGFSPSKSVHPWKQESPTVAPEPEQVPEPVPEVEAPPSPTHEAPVVEQPEAPPVQEEAPAPVKPAPVTKQSPTPRSRAGSTLDSPRSRAGSMAASPRNYRNSRLDQILPTADKEFDDDVDQGEFETLKLGHKYKLAGNEDGDLLISSVSSQAAKDKFNSIHGTSY